jgi:outer membrane biosynthesis protein TonB
MHHRLIVVPTVLCLALMTGGCESWGDSAMKSKKEYQEVLMPAQTGSALQRRTYVPRGPEEKKKSKKKETKAPKPETEPSPTPTPTPEEESSPPPADRFR